MTEARRPVVFETEHRVRFRELDPYGHMNMAYYVTYFSDHRFEGMRRFIGLDFKGIDALPIAFHIANVSVDYLRPLVADQAFTVRSFVAELKRTQCIVDFAMTDEAGQTVATCKMRIGCIDKQSGKVTAWPDGLMERFFQ